jgi:uncharacterized protein (TIGR03067 family)
MKTQWLIIVAVSLLVAADAKEDAVKTDLKKLQGHWKLVSAVVDGKKLSADLIKDRGDRIEIEGEKYTYRGLVIREMTLALDPTKNPKEIDLTQRRGDQTKVWRAIYEVDGDTLKVCRHKDGDGEPRPTGFTSKAGSGWSSSVWKREKR